MFTIELRRHKYRISFQHITPGKYLEDYSFKDLTSFRLAEEKFRYGTICEISDPDSDFVVLSVGVSKLHPNDFGSFDKSKGRMIALNQALGRIFPDRKHRKLIWDEYRKVISKQKENQNVKENL